LKLIDIEEPIKQAWLNYAWEVITDTSHHLACEKLGGQIFGETTVNTRWPGYIGLTYESGNPIFVSNIHRNFDSGGLSDDPTIVGEFTQTNNAWLKAGRNQDADDKFITSSARNYERGLTSWNVGSVMRRYFKYSEFNWSDIAYFNVAKCQSKNAGSKLQDLCIKRWPIERLIDALRPSAIVTCSLKIRDRNLANTQIYWYHQLNKTNEMGRRQDDWMSDLIAQSKK
jgi:hypothetical protein